LPSPDQHLLPVARLAVAGMALLAAWGPVNAAAPQTEANEQRQKLEHLRDVSAQARNNATELRREMDELQAEAVDRGLLLTLDDTLFTTNAVGLSIPGHRRLDAMAAFLDRHPERNVAVHGYAGAGNYRYDQALSTRRADAIKAYLARRGIAPNRLTAQGNGDWPQGDDDSAANQPRQRRVEVIIEDPLTPAPPLDVTAPGT
jgi:outer membrane protein OmpA-like peptidoglycan-associated protein